MGETPDPETGREHSRNSHELPAETPYGVRFRLEFFLDQIRRHWGEDSPALKIIEIGCGTGAQITTPLAGSLPNSVVVGTDIHRPSIDEAKRHGRDNTLFRACGIEEEAAEAFDVVICSEVLEHLTDPQEMLLEIRRVLHPAGIALVTIPNGFGPKEVEDFFKRQIVRVVPPLRRFISSTNHTVHSLNPAGHLQFFTMRRFRRIVGAADLEILEYCGRRFLGGPFSSRMLRTPRSIRWNVSLGRVLPPWMVSSWMFALHRTS